MKENTVRIMPANGGVVSGWQQGYVDGIPDGTMLYNKIYNDNPSSALSILYFDHPVRAVGSFIADSLPAQNTLTVNLYDSADNLLATVNPQVNVWTNGDNTEGYWGVISDTADIAKVTIVSPSTYYAVTTLDNIEFLAPEPATLTLLGSALLGLGIVYLRRRGAKGLKAANS